MVLTNGHVVCAVELHVVWIGQVRVAAGAQVEAPLVPCRLQHLGLSPTSELRPYHMRRVEAAEVSDGPFNGAGGGSSAGGAGGLDYR